MVFRETSNELERVSAKEEQSRMNGRDLLIETTDYFMEIFGYPKRPIHQNPQTHTDLGKEI